MRRRVPRPDKSEAPRSTDRSRARSGTGANAQASLEGEHGEEPPLDAAPFAYGFLPPRLFGQLMIRLRGVWSRGHGKATPRD